MTTQKVITDSEGKDLTEEFLKDYHHNEEAQSNLPKIIPKNALTNSSSKPHSQTVNKAESHETVPKKIKDTQSELIGEFGLWQGIIFSTVALTIIIHAWQMMANKFLTYPLVHWCERPENYRNVSVESWLNISSPVLSDGSFDRCNIFDVDYDNSIVDRPSEDTPTTSCKSWEYDETIFQDTATKRFDLVCEKRFFGKAVQMTFFVGNMVGVLFLGSFSDWFGRKTAYMTTLTLWMIFGISGYFATNEYVWLIIRFFCGAMSLSFNTAKSVYCLELTSGKWKSRTAHYFGELPWQLGHLTLGFLVYVIPNMQSLELFIGLSAVIFMPLWYFLPESPRWLASKGKLDEAKKVLITACKFNKKPIDRVEKEIQRLAVAQKDKEKEKNGMMHDLFKTPAVRRNSFIICFCWLAFSMGYFGLIYNTPSFEANIYLVFVVPALIGIPISIIQPYFDNKFGRKKMMTIPLVTAGILLLITTGIPKGTAVGNWSVIVLAWAGTCFCGMAFGMGYILTLELYPTLYRTTALGMASAGARVGSLLSPLIAMLSVVHPVLPLGVYGAIVLAAGISSIWLWPETLHTQFTETLEECEDLASTPNAWLNRSKKMKPQIEP